MTIEVIGRPGMRRLPFRRAGEAAERVLRLAGRAEARLTILFTGDAEIRRLNRRYRGIDRPTDVLAFPADPDPGPHPYLGDLAISTPAAIRQARRAGWRVEEEMRFLILHGVLHLLGYDHERDDGEMERLQRRMAGAVLGRTIPPLRGGAEPPARARRRR